MNAQTLAHRAYTQTAASARTDRDNEYRLIATISHRLREAAQDKDPRAFPKLAAALNDNLRLWTQLAVDVAHPENALPQATRASIFFLAEFVQQHTPKVLAREATVVTLLQINAAILKGLAGKGATG